jgi:outer membrane protein TolC
MKSGFVFKTSLRQLFGCVLPWLLGFGFGPVLAQGDSAGLAENAVWFNPVIKQFIDEALKNNPELKAARFKVQASQAMVKGKKALDPPQFGVEFYQAPVNSFPNPFRDQMEMDYSLSQMVPFPGKLAPMAKAETERSAMFSGDAGALEWKIIRQVKTACYELWSLRRQLEINAENHMHLLKISQVAQKQYEVESGRYAELLRAQAEYSRLTADSIRLHQQELSMTAMLNALLNRPPAAEIKIPDTLPVPEISWSFTQLSGLAEKHRPELSAMAASRRMARWEAMASRRELLPDFMLRLMYKDMMMTRADYWSFMVNVNIPVAPWSFSMADSKYRQARFAESQAGEDYQSMRNMVAAQVQSTLSSVEGNQALRRLYREVTIPKAQQALESSLAGYPAGHMEFSMLIETWHMLAMVKEEYYMATMNLLQSQAGLEQAVGVPLEDIPAELSPKVQP